MTKLDNYLLLHSRGNIGDRVAFYACFDSIRRTKKCQMSIFPAKYELSPEVCNSKFDKIFICGSPVFGNSENQLHKFIATDEKYKIDIPIIPFGVGTQSKFDEKGEVFDEKSVAFLKYIHSKIPYSSVRDNETGRQLKNIGINNFRVTGPPSLFIMKNEVRIKCDRLTNVLVTTKYREGMEKENTRFLEMVKERFLNCNLYYSIHDMRNITEKKHPIWTAEKMGYRLFNPNGVKWLYDFYSTMDIHVGFRLHAHTVFLSMGKPSFLISCDRRGSSFSETMNTAKTDMTLDNFHRLPEIVKNEFDNDFEGFRKFEQEYKVKNKELYEFLETYVGSSPFQYPFDGDFMADEL